MSLQLLVEYCAIDRTTLGDVRLPDVSGKTSLSLWCENRSAAAIGPNVGLVQKTLPVCWEDTGVLFSLPEDVMLVLGSANDVFLRYCNGGVLELWSRLLGEGGFLGTWKFEPHREKRIRGFGIIYSK